MHPILERLVPANRAAIEDGTLLAMGQQVAPCMEICYRQEGAGRTYLCGIGVAMTKEQLDKIASLFSTAGPLSFPLNGSVGGSDIVRIIAEESSIDMVEIDILLATQKLHDAWATGAGEIGHVGQDLPDQLAALYDEIETNSDSSQPVNRDDYWKWLAEVEQWIRQQNGQLSRDDPV